MKAAVIGHPIAHSLSPTLFAAFGRATGLELDYRAVDVTPEALGSTLGQWRDDQSFVGCNVTMPHKRAIVAHLDETSTSAQACDAVNVVRRDGATLVGDNTDVIGIAATLELLELDPARKRAVIFGAGGGAQAVATVLAERGAAEIWIVARTLERAQALAARAGGLYPATLIAALRMNGEEPPPADLYVNATPTGMAGHPARALLPSNVPRGAAAFDLVYRPADTPFVRDARSRGANAIGGFPMLLEQALATYERWFGIRPTLDARNRADLEALACAT